MIKYRVFDKRLNSYHGSSGITSLVENGIWSLKVEDNQVLELFTGLQDKDGVDIYVGDIVVTMSNLKGFVYFDKSNVSFRLKSNLDDYALTVDKVQRLEIIGNINENKELLE